MGAKHLTPLIVAILASVVGVYAKMQFGSAKVSELANEVTSFMVVGDWGGSPVAPYTTPGQLAAAAAMAKIAVEQLATFVVSPGGNFYGGLQGARPDASSRGRVPVSFRAYAAGSAARADHFDSLRCTGCSAARSARAVAPVGGSTFSAKGSNWALARAVNGQPPIQVGRSREADSAHALYSPARGFAGPEGSTSVQDRFQASWDDVYNTPYPTTLGTLPWYTVSGAADWWGNVTGARLNDLVPMLRAAAAGWRAGLSLTSSVSHCSRDGVQRHERRAVAVPGPLLHVPDGCPLLRRHRRVHHDRHYVAHRGCELHAGGPAGSLLPAGCPGAEQRSDAWGARRILRSAALCFFLNQRALCSFPSIIAIASAGACLRRWAPRPFLLLTRLCWLLCAPRRTRTSTLLRRPRATCRRAWPVRARFRCENKYAAGSRVRARASSFRPGVKMNLFSTYLPQLR